MKDMVSIKCKHGMTGMLHVMWRFADVKGGVYCSDVSVISNGLSEFYRVCSILIASSTSHIPRRHTLNPPSSKLGSDAKPYKLCLLTRFDPQTPLPHLNSHLKLSRTGGGGPKGGLQCWLRCRSRWKCGQRLATANCKGGLLKLGELRGT